MYGTENRKRELNRKNLIILCADEMRGDCAGFMGNHDIMTPNLDVFAEQSIVFENHMTVFPKCVPARASLVTGRYCHTDGWRTVSQTLEFGQVNILDRFKENGYQTALFGKNHCWHEDDLQHTFDYTSHKAPYDEFLANKEERISKDALKPKKVQPMELESGWNYIGCSSRHALDEVYTDQAVDYLKNRGDKIKPFFMQVNIESPHPLYGVEEPWFSMYNRNDIRPWPHQLPKNAPLPLVMQREVRTGMEEQEAAAREIQCTYYGMITKVDMLLGKILQTVKEEGLLENSIILFWSDHGDYAGQHTLVEKWDTDFRDCLIHVPFILFAPNLPKGKRIDSLTETSDIAPTLCELLGLEPLPGMHGQSLLPVILGDVRKKAVFADGGHEVEMRRRFSDMKWIRSSSRLAKTETYLRYPDTMARAKMIRTERYKMVIRQTGGNELYDLQDDPWEMKNRWRDPSLAEVTQELMLLLVEWCLNTDPEQPYLEKFTV